jgi:hypothetical protein
MKKKPIKSKNELEKILDIKDEFAVDQYLGNVSVKDFLKDLEDYVNKMEESSFMKGYSEGGFAGYE